MPNLIRLERILSQNLTIHKAKINCLSLMIIAIITAQSSNLKKIARHFTNSTTNDSNYRRIQRFFAQTPLNEHQIARLIFQLFGLNKVTLTIEHLHVSCCTQRHCHTLILDNARQTRQLKNTRENTTH